MQLRATKLFLLLVMTLLALGGVTTVSHACPHHMQASPAEQVAESARKPAPEPAALAAESEHQLEARSAGKHTRHMECPSSRHGSAAAFLCCCDRDAAVALVSRDTPPTESGIELQAKLIVALAAKVQALLLPLRAGLDPGLPHIDQSHARPSVLATTRRLRI